MYSGGVRRTNTSKFIIYQVAIKKRVMVVV